jgi:hypothetical protein
MHWVDEDAIVFARDIRGQWRTANAGFSVSSLRKRIVLGNVLPWAGQLIVVPARNVLKSDSIHKADAKNRVALDRRLSLLGMLSTILFAGVLMVTPLLLITGMGSRSIWLLMGVCLMAVFVAVPIFFWRAHRHYYPSDREHRWVSLITILFYLPAAMRVGDNLSVKLGQDRHPLLMAFIFLSKSEFSILAESVLRKLTYPAESEDLDIAGRSLQATHELLRSLKISPECLLQPPDPTTDSCAYCPRCKTEFTRPNGTCPDCVGVALVRFQA